MEPKINCVVKTIEIYKSTEGKFYYMKFNENGDQTENANGSYVTSEYNGSHFYEKQAALHAIEKEFKIISKQETPEGYIVTVEDIEKEFDPKTQLASIAEDKEIIKGKGKGKN